MAKEVPLLIKPFERPFPDVELAARTTPGGMDTIRAFIDIWKKYKYAGLIYAMQECAYEVRNSLPEFRRPSLAEEAMRGANSALFLVEDDYDRLNEVGFDIDYEVLEGLLDYLAEGPVDRIKKSAPFRKVVSNCTKVVSRYGVETFYYVLYVANAMAATKALPVSDEEAMVAGAVAVELDLLWKKFLSSGTGGPPPPPGTVLH